MNQLKQYIIALTNLYGMVHKDKVVDIYNSQNEKQVKLKEVEVFLTDLPEELGDAFIMIHKDFFVHEAIMLYDEFGLMLTKKADKPYYIPAKNELLRYSDEGYFEKTKQYNALVNYIKKNFFDDAEERAEDFCHHIHGMCKFEFDMQSIMDSFNDQSINFRDIDQVNELMSLIMALSNNIRIWGNNGHTPHEIFEKYEKPKLKPLPSQPFEIRGSNVIDINTKTKVGRNDPCPCGSGKKYKKCCLRKSE
ncbi:MAG TPA: hypothetical protein GX707_12485 [Epulopiscium sp.]|nr:hypothetical protein [Candidatus Epulonipiscium sp.]